MRDSKLAIRVPRWWGVFWRKQSAKREVHTVKFWISLFFNKNFSILNIENGCLIFFSFELFKGSIKPLLKWLLGSSFFLSGFQKMSLWHSFVYEWKCEIFLNQLELENCSLSLEIKLWLANLETGNSKVAKKLILIKSNNSIIHCPAWKMTIFSDPISRILIRGFVKASI